MNHRGCLARPLSIAWPECFINQLIALFRTGRNEFNKIKWYHLGPMPLSRLAANLAPDENK